MSGKEHFSKKERREAVAEILRQNPCLTDADLAEQFSVSVATVRLDRQILGIPQMRERVEQVVSEGFPQRRNGLKVIDLDIGKKGIALFNTDESMAGSEGMVSAEYFYGAAAKMAQYIVGISFLPTQVGNVKYKISVVPDKQLIVKGRVVLMRGNKKYVYISFSNDAQEVFRAKFIMETLIDKDKKKI